MVVIEHGCYAVEAETVEAEFVHPVSDVGQEELLDVHFSVVEQFGVPSRMPSGWPVHEIQFFFSVEFAEPFGTVFHCVRVDQVHNDGYTHSVCRIDQITQVVRRTETRGRCEKIGYMVTERAVIRVFLYGHKLEGVVAERGYARQHIVRQFAPRSYVSVTGGHTGVCFVYERCIAFRKAESCVLPEIGAFRYELA